MNYKEILSAGKVAYEQFKTEYGEGEGRFVVQFQNLQCYQYKTNMESLTKLSKVDFDKEVIMVQFAYGDSIKKGRYFKFVPIAVKTLYIQQDFVCPIEEEKEAQNDLPPWE